MQRLRKSPSPTLSEAAEQPSSAEIPMTGALPQSEPRRTAVPESPGTLRGYLEGTSKSGLSQLPFPISQQAAAATEQPVSVPGQGQRNVVLSAPGDRRHDGNCHLNLQILSLNACLVHAQ